MENNTSNSIKKGIKVIILLFFLSCSFIIIKKLFDGSPNPPTTSVSVIVGDLHDKKQLVVLDYYDSQIVIDTVDNGKLTQAAKAVIKIGYDFSQMKEEDLKQNNDTLLIRLPAIKIIEAISNPSDWVVINDQVDDQELQKVRTKYLNEAKRKVQKEGVLEKADSVGKKKVESLLKLMSGASIIVFRD